MYGLKEAHDEISSLNEQLEFQRQRLQEANYQLSMRNKDVDKLVLRMETLCKKHGLDPKEHVKVDDVYMDLRKELVCSSSICCGRALEYVY